MIHVTRRELSCNSPKVRSCNLVNSTMQRMSMMHPTPSKPPHQPLHPPTHFFPSHHHPISLSYLPSSRLPRHNNPVWHHRLHIRHNPQQVLNDLITLLVPRILDPLQLFLCILVRVFFGLFVAGGLLTRVGHLHLRGSLEGGGGRACGGL